MKITKKEFEKLKQMLNYDWSKYKVGDHIFVQWHQQIVDLGEIFENLGDGKFRFARDNDIWDAMDCEGGYFGKIILN